jgi:hypothetical protein
MFGGEEVKIFQTANSKQQTANSKQQTVMASGICVIG